MDADLSARVFLALVADEAERARVQRGLEGAALPDGVELRVVTRAEAEALVLAERAHEDRMQRGLDDLVRQLADEAAEAAPRTDRAWRRQQRRGGPFFGAPVALQ